jgi:CHAP domain
MIDIMDRRPRAGRLRRPAGAGPAVTLAGLCCVALLVLQSAPAGAAGSSPPVPPGSVKSSLLTPLIYPGGGIDAFGDASGGMAADVALRGNDPSFNAPVTAMATAPTADGMWLAGADGSVATTGGAAFHGTVADLTLNGPIVGMAATPTGGGYWLVALDGGIFSFGNAAYEGSMGGHPLNQPIVGMAATATGHGYWLVAADGGIFAFGTAQFYGSMGGKPLVESINGMAPTPTGAGYWLVAGDGGIFAFGNANFFGSMGGKPLNDPVVGMATTSTGGGYWLVGWDGGVFTFGNALFHGSAANGPAAAPFVAIAPTPDGGGYWLLEPDGFSSTFDDPPGGSSPIVAAAASQIQPDPDQGYFCNPYGPCEEWCALFATWAWEQGGVPIPSYAFTGNIFTWAAQNTGVLPSTAIPAPGDAVLYGTGPATTSSSVHVGIVAQVWPDGAIDTIEGDAGPGDAGSLAVVVNGPFLPADSLSYNGFGIYAYAQP